MNEKTKLQTSEKTAKNELAMINNHLIPYFKDKDINQIDYGEMLKFFTDVDQMVSVKKHTLGEPWKTATKRHLIRTFKKRCFTMGMNQVSYRLTQQCLAGQPKTLSSVHGIT